LTAFCPAFSVTLFVAGVHVPFAEKTTTPLEFEPRFTVVFAVTLETLPYGSCVWTASVPGEHTPAIKVCAAVV